MDNFHWNVVLPVGFALLALAVAWGATLTRQKAMGKEIEDIKEKREIHKKEYLTIEGHKLLCENTALRFEAHVTEVVNTMGDTLISRMEALINGENKP